ncbi:MAG: hypothetical protein ACLRPR_04395 [Eisenbergiella sp.]
MSSQTDAPQYGLFFSSRDGDAAIHKQCQAIRCKKTDRTRQHKEEYSGSSKKSTGKTYSTGSSSYSGTGMGSSGKKQSAGGNPYEAYDSGYDDVFLDGDYDYDRYYNDSDYADGVDDALEDYEDDWE